HNWPGAERWLRARNHPCPARGGTVGATYEPEQASSVRPRARRAAACNAWKLAIRSNRRSCRRRILPARPCAACRLQPAADQTAGLVEGACRVLVATSVQHPEIGGESEQEAKLLDPQVCAAQVSCAVSGGRWPR